MCNRQMSGCFLTNNWGLKTSQWRLIVLSRPLIGIQKQRYKWCTLFEHSYICCINKANCTVFESALCYGPVFQDLLRPISIANLPKVKKIRNASLL